MFFCGLVEFLVSALPVRGLQDFLVRRHVQKCPRCAGRLISREEARLCLEGERDVPEDPIFVRKVAGRAAQEMTRKGPWRSRKKPFARWAYAAAGLLFFVGVLLWFSRGGGRNSGRLAVDTREKFRINYLKVDGAPADALIIQPRDSDMVIIWVDRNFGSPNRDGNPGGRP